MHCDFIQNNCVPHTRPLNFWCMHYVSWNLLYGYSLINPCEKNEECVAPYGYKHAMTLSTNTNRFAVS